jgi:hypothetical protein
MVPPSQKVNKAEELIDLHKHCLMLSLAWQLTSMEQHTLKNVNNCLNTNIYCYLVTSGGQSSNKCLNVVHFFNTSAN